jgi:hypothetical protein
MCESHDVCHIITGYTVHYTGYTIHYTGYTVHYTGYTVHYTGYIVHYIGFTVHYTGYTAHYTGYTVHYKGYTVHYTQQRFPYIFCPQPTEASQVSIATHSTRSYLAPMKIAEDLQFIKKIT